MKLKQRLGKLEALLTPKVINKQVSPEIREQQYRLIEEVEKHRPEVIDLLFKPDVSEKVKQERLADAFEEVHGWRPTFEE